MGHTVEEIREEFKRLDLLVGVDTGAVEIAFSPRAVYRFGSCRYQKIRGKAVPVKVLIAAFLQEEDGPFWDTVRHEYAHAAAALLTGKNHGHDEVWRKICRTVGADPTRLARECAAQEQLRQEKIQYRIRCVQCGKEYCKMRRGKFLNAVIAAKGKPIPYRCGCGSQCFILADSLTEKKG